MTTDYEPQPQVSGWAVGGTLFAAVLMVMAGFFHVIAGFTAILDDEFYVVTRNYVFDLDVTAWGWIHLILGIVLVVAGAYIITGATWARLIGITLAVISAVANFFFVPYFEIWSVIVIAIDVWIIWSLSRPVVSDA
ncbi:MAG TPA: hypothetical protein VFO84_10730 [Dehalococcoidia bacterium]|nr:hypothetical protein [Dehalococcoidia bacterium]